MKIKIGDICRYHYPTSVVEKDGLIDFYLLTKGRHTKGVGIGGKGIFSYAKVSERSKEFSRIPAIILHSNPFKEGTEVTPWIDVINPDDGYAIYNGDNKTAAKTAFESDGNKILVDLLPLYFSSTQRILAPPILIFKQEIVNGERKGYRSFQGYGIPTNVFIRTQKELHKENKNASYFTNLVFEIAIFKLESENDEFNWDWIDSRRDEKLNSEETLEHAPKAWKEWIKHGNESVERLRRRVSTRYVIRENDQHANNDDEDILKEIYNYYSDKKHHFEGLSSLISTKIIGSNCKRGWVTKRSGDGGVDFVNRLDIEGGLTKTKIVVLGQAKCIDPSSSISGHDLARVVARLQRGWIGIFITTGTFSQSAQKELFDDKYPIVLVNGKRLTQEIKKIVNIENIEINTLLDRESEWYEKNMRLESVSRIIDWEFPESIVD